MNFAKLIENENEIERIIKCLHTSGLYLTTKSQEAGLDQIIAEVCRTEGYARIRLASSLTERKECRMNE